MHRVNLIFAEDEWILARSAIEIKKAIPEVSMNQVGEINYFINYAQYKDMPGISIANFTHLEEKGNWRKVFLQVAKKVDYCTALCENTANILKEAGAKHVDVIHYGVHVSPKPIRFGVAGRVYPSGRKGEFLIQHMIDHGYEVVGLGEGWPCENVKMDKEEFFRSIDYFIVPSLNEGGPHPILDALAYRVPVIAPNVGWCWDYSVIRYDKGNWNSLHNVIKKLTPRSWEDWASDHRNLFSRILERI